LNATANMLRTLLGSTQPGNVHLNPHLDGAEIAETIRVAIECIETQEAQHNDSERLRAVLVNLSRAATATNSPQFVAIPAKDWQTLLDAIVSRETP